MSCIPEGNTKCRYIYLCCNFPCSCEECQEKRTLFNRHPNACHALTPLQKFQRKQYLDSLKEVDRMRKRHNMEFKKTKIETRIDEDDKKFIAEICYCVSCEKPIVELYYGFKKDGHEEDWDDCEYLIDNPLFFDPDDDFQIRIEFVTCGDTVSFSPEIIGVKLSNIDILKDILRSTKFKSYDGGDYSHYFCSEECFKKWFLPKIKNK